MRSPAILAFVLPLSLSLPAQVVRGGDILVPDYGIQGSSPPAVWRVEPNGTISPLLYGSSQVQGPSGVTVASNGDVIVTDSRASSLLRIDAQTGVVAPVATGVSGVLRVVEMFDGDFAVTSYTSRSVLRITPGGVVTTIASWTSPARPFGIANDLNGDLLVTVDLGPNQDRGLYRVTPTGAVTPVSTGFQFRLPQGVALFPNGDYAVIDGISDHVMRVDRVSQVATTWVSSGALNANPEGIVTDGSGGFYISHSGLPSGSGVRYIDALGSVTALPVIAPAWSNPESLTRVPYVRGPRTLTTGLGSQFTYPIDAPGLAGQYYSLILSGSVFPGWPLFGVGPRSLSLNLDPFFAATIGHNSPPFLMGWTGFLSPTGTATANVDLSFLPSGLLSGVVLYQQGLFIDVSVGSITAATDVLRLELQ